MRRPRLTALLAVPALALLASGGTPAPVATPGADVQGGVATGSERHAPPQTDPLDDLLQQLAFVHSPAGQAALGAIATDPTLVSLLGIGGPVDLDFDETTQPFLFVETRPLKGLYQGQAYFWAPGTDGGAILDQASNFGLNAASQPNFLAFNATATYSGARGIPRLPEIIAVGPGHTAVTLVVSQGSVCGSGYLVLEAFGPEGTVDLRAFTPSTTRFDSVTLTGRDIAGIAVFGSATCLLIDDLTAE